MPITDAQKKATNTYRNKLYSLQIMLPKEYKEGLKECADKHGESVSSYVKKAIDNAMAKDRESSGDMP